MRDRKDITKALAKVFKERRPAVLATLVNTEGSFYRKSGARILVELSESTNQIQLSDSIPTTTGLTITGLISGGCFEEELYEFAQKTWDLGHPRLYFADLTAPDEVLLGYGTGCPGKVWILFEPILNHSENHIEKNDFETLAGKMCNFALKNTKPDTNTGIGIVYDSSHPLIPLGQRMFVGQSLTQGLRLCLEQFDFIDIKSWVLPPKWGPQELRFKEHRVKIFCEPTLQSRNIHLFGAGPDAAAFYDIAWPLGWTLYIYDHRPAYALASRFPHAEQVLQCAYDHGWSPQNLGQNDAVVLMTHNLPKDAQILQEIIKYQPRYIGILGSRKRITLLKKYMLEPEHVCNIVPQVHQGPIDWSKIHSPIGLNLGGEDPWSIALAIAAEIQMKCHS